MDCDIFVNIVLMGSLFYSHSVMTLSIVVHRIINVLIVISHMYCTLNLGIVLCWSSFEELCNLQSFKICNSFPCYEECTYSARTYLEIMKLLSLFWWATPFTVHVWWLTGTKSITSHRQGMQSTLVFVIKSYPLDAYCYFTHAICFLSTIFASASYINHLVFTLLFSFVFCISWIADGFL